MRAEGLSYSEAGRRFGIEAHTLLQIWERIYLAESPEDFAIERRGHSTSSGIGGCWKKREFGRV